ncbi:MAG: ABC transporter ATP-binding protein [Anaerolineales bacterium]|nr:ABC transporter ATP-binding protein [Anaerolineales bacterium]
MKSLLRLKDYLKPYRFQAILALVLLALVVAVDLTIPRLIQRVIDDGISAGRMDIVLSTGALMIGATLLSALFSIGNSILSVRVGESLGRDLRESLFRKTLSFSFENLDHLQTGQLLVRLTSDVNTTQQVVQMFMRIGTRAPLLGIGSLLMMYRTSPRLTLIFVPIAVLITVLISIFAGKLQKLFLAVQKKLDKLNTVLQENLAGTRVIKAFVRQAFENKRFNTANVNLMEQTIETSRLMAVLMPAVFMILNLGIVAVIWFGGNAAMSSTLTIGELMAFINYLTTTMVPMLMLVMIIGVVAAASASASRILEVLQTQPSIQDQEAARPLTSARGRISFENVRFNYDGGHSQDVLEDVNFSVEPGETVAILGATGSGKTTLINLIPRFYEAKQGQIKINGQDVREYQQESLQARIGVVMQETVLFSGTIRDNIRYGHPDASEEEVVAAARAAEAHDFIHTLPDGYDTHINQRGTNLSGGQKQRLALARALLIKPDILILDDSTSAVDVDTEARIQDTLEKLLYNTTTFIIAQRISSVLTADKILILNEGRIHAVGTHKQLLASDPIYQEIYQSQLGNGSVNHD